MTFDMTNHLASRHFDRSLYSGLSITDEDMTVMLWNLSGQAVGYQVYSPHKPKKADTPKEAKYFTYLTKGQIAVFGLETVKKDSTVLFVCEGIFDAARLHLHGIPAIAVLGNNPEHLTSWLRTLPYTTMATVQGDKAGQMLAKCADSAVYLPEGEDVNSLDEETFEKMFSQFYK